MGEAKYKKATRAAAGGDIAQIDLSRVAAAMRKLFSISPIPGADCYRYAAYGQHLLQRLNVATRVVIGYAAWSVGVSDGEVIAHHPACSWQDPPRVVAYHAWIEVGGRIIDFTTHNLPHKAARLDARDGRCTNVDWCPEFLVAEKHKVAGSLNQVEQSRRVGVFYYERVPSLEARVRAAARPLDDYLLEALWLIYQNPDAKVFFVQD